MEKNSTRRELIRNTPLGAGVLTTAAAANLGAEPGQPPAHQHEEYPRNQPGRGGPVGSATDRGKLVPGLRKPDLTPVSVVTPDNWMMKPTMKDGVKEYYLHATVTRREFLPGAWINVWGYNDAMPGPTIQTVEGDRVRISLYNMLPAPTVLHR